MSKSENWTQIAVATIGLVGTLGVALITSDRLASDPPEENPPENSLEQPDAPTQADQSEFRVGLTLTEFQTVFDEYVAKGYQLTSISVGDSPQQESYAGIWQESSERPWLAQAGLGPEEFLQTFEQRQAEGYRLRDIGCHWQGGATACTGIWEQASAPAGIVQLDLTASEFQLAFDEYLANGYRLVNLDSYPAGAEVRYAGIWELADSQAYAAHLGLSTAEFQEIFDQYLDRGYRLLDISAVTVSGEARFAGIWEAAADSAWISRAGLSAQALEAADREYAAQGLRMIHVDGYGGGTYAAIWSGNE